MLKLIAASRSNHGVKQVVSQLFDAILAFHLSRQPALMLGRVNALPVRTTTLFPVVFRTNPTKPRLNASGAPVCHRNQVAHCCDGGRKEAANTKTWFG
jgi:hypothetical protein